MFVLGQIKILFFCQVSLSCAVLCQTVAITQQIILQVLIRKYIIFMEVLTLQIVNNIIQ